MLAKEEIARMVEAVMQKMAREGVIEPAVEQGARAAQRAAAEGAVPTNPTGVYATVTEAARAARADAS